MEERRSYRETIEKFDIKLKSKPKDGVILQLHHTVRCTNGESRRIRFTTAAFDDGQDKLACADNGGNLFILDFSELKFWKHTHVGPCSVIHFIPNKVDNIVVATTKRYDISFMDIETGATSVTLSGHTAPILHMSFSSTKSYNLLTASPAEAILWEMRNYTKYFTLNTYLGAQIQQIMFTPINDYLVACFQNDTIQIWKHESMKSVKQIIPGELKHLKCIAFTMNGRAMAMAGLTPILILFSMDTWKAIRTLELTKYHITAVQQLEFIPQVFDGGSNKILAILSSDCIVYLLDLESNVIIHKISPESSRIRKLIISTSGKYFACLLQLGEVNIYNTSHVMDMAQNATGDQLTRNFPSSSHHNHPTLEPNIPSKAEVEQKMRICLDGARLRRILMQYGEYPDKYRSIIWRSLLNTPKNRNAYIALLDKGIHSSYKDIEKQFTIHSSITLKNLKRILSCLSHWCPLFAVMKFLPAFVFPFVKVLQKDPLLLFECVATILLNYCQLWFEYAPFPPISILAMIENILAEHDSQLLEHFCNIGVTSQTYALKILETAFSEVLSCSEWLILWDHILSNEPSFILMVVVAYNIAQRNALKKFKTHEEFDDFYHMQNPIDKKFFLKKAYILLNDTSNDVHPRKFFNDFTSLEKGNSYQQFTGYPKATICLKLAKNYKKNYLESEKKLTLNQLTKNAQEREISERSKVKNDLQEKGDYDDENIDYTKQNSQKSTRKSHQHKSCVKDELLENILYPVMTFNTNDCKDNESTICRTCKGTKNCIDKQKRNETLEKEVEKLIKPCSDSDLSDL